MVQWLALVHVFLWLFNFPVLPFLCKWICGYIYQFRFYPVPFFLFILNIILFCFLMFNAGYDFVFHQFVLFIWLCRLHKNYKLKIMREKIDTQTWAYLSFNSHVLVHIGEIVFSCNKSIEWNQSDSYYVSDVVKYSGLICFIFCKLLKFWLFKTKEHYILLIIIYIRNHFPWRVI